MKKKLRRSKKKTKRNTKKIKRLFFTSGDKKEIKKITKLLDKDFEFINSGSQSSIKINNNKLKEDIIYLQGLDLDFKNKQPKKKNKKSKKKSAT